MRKIFLIVMLISCTNKKAEIVDQIRVQQNLIDSLKHTASNEIASTDYSLGVNYKKLADIDKQIAAAQKSIDSLNLELKKY